MPASRSVRVLDRFMHLNVYQLAGDNSCASLSTSTLLAPSLVRILGNAGLKIGLPNINLDRCSILTTAAPSSTPSILVSPQNPS